MKNEQIEPLSNPDDPDAGHGAKPGWPPGITDLLDHLAQELALEYVRLMEHAAETEASTPIETRGEED
jgi:hypothetical protein